MVIIQNLCLKKVRSCITVNLGWPWNNAPKKSNHANLTSWLLPSLCTATYLPPPPPPNSPQEKIRKGDGERTGDHELCRRKKYNLIIGIDAVIVVSLEKSKVSKVLTIMDPAFSLVPSLQMGRAKGFSLSANSRLKNRLLGGLSRRLLLGN